MYQRLKASLLKPRSLVNYVNDKLGITLVYLLIFSMIFALSYLLVFKDFGSELKGTISAQLRDGEVIEYTIKDGELVSKLDEPKTYLISLEKTSFNYLTFIVGNDLNVLKDTNLSASIVIQYATDGIYFCQTSFLETKTKLIDYSLEFVDFSLIKTGDTNSLKGFTKYIEMFISQNKTAIYFIAIPSLFIYAIGEILFTTLMSAVILLIFFNKTGIKFGKIYKITLYCALPNLLGILLTVLFSGFAIAGLFSNIGFIATTCYAMIALNELTRINMKDKEVNDHESI